MKNVSLTGLFVKTYMTISLAWAKADTAYHKMKATAQNKSLIMPTNAAKLKQA